jgi:hypothetical protein
MRPFTRSWRWEGRSRARHAHWSGQVGIGCDGRGPFVLYRDLRQWHGRSIWGNVGTHVVLQVGIIKVGGELERGRLRLVIYTTKGHEVLMWLSTVGSCGPGDSNGWIWRSWDQLTTTLWQRSVRKLPRLVEAIVGAKDRIDCEWRAWIVRQKAIIVRMCTELVEVVVIISTLGCLWLAQGRCRLKPECVACIGALVTQKQKTRLTRQLGRCLPIAQRAHVSNINILKARQPKAFQRAEIGFPCFRVSCLIHLVKPHRHAGRRGLLRRVLRLRANQLQAQVDVC